MPAQHPLSIELRDQNIEQSWNKWLLSSGCGSSNRKKRKFTTHATHKGKKINIKKIIGIKYKNHILPFLNTGGVVLTIFVPLFIIEKTVYNL